MKRRLSIKAALGWLFTAFIVLWACSPLLSTQATRKPPKADAVFAERFLALVSAQNFSAAKAMVLPAYMPNDDQLANLAHYIPAGPIVSTEIVDWQSFHLWSPKSGSHTWNTIYIQYHFKNTWVLMTARLAETAGSRSLANVNLEKFPKSLQEINKFEPRDRPFGYYIFLALMACTALFIAIAFIICIKTPMRRRKWLWALFILFGIGRITLNWTTGALNVAPLSGLLLGAGWIRFGLYGPVMLQVGIPVGALLFLANRKRLDSSRLPKTAVDVSQGAGTAPE